MRDTFVKTLIGLAEKDKDIELITGDLGFGVLKPFWEKLPDQFTNAGIAEQNMEEISIHKHIARRSRRLIVLADSSKFSRSASFHAYHFEEISSIITDDQLDEEIARKYRKSGVDLVIA